MTNANMLGIFCGILFWVLGYLLAPAPTDNGQPGILGDLPVLWRNFLRGTLLLVSLIVIGLMLFQGYELGSFRFVWEFAVPFVACVFCYWLVRYRILFI